MRLLNTSTIQLHEFFGSNIPPYAILSHRWQDGEISFKDVTKSRNLNAPGWAKVRASCALAKSRDQQWIWIDTCCIDRRSSAELSEAINSMFAWYKKSEECYVYLVDVPAEADSKTFMKKFRRSEWFRRGWTLQELIAPGYVHFYDQAWAAVGTRDSLGQEISSITGIAVDHLSIGSTYYTNGSFPVSKIGRALSIAKRMSWASRRVCTREEDMAYCLLGIFKINMPLLYGEGGLNAFRRLQLEVLKTSDDESIFAWYSVTYLSPDEELIYSRYQFGHPSVVHEPNLLEIVHRANLDQTPGQLLAPSPAYFIQSRSIERWEGYGRLPYTVTNKGLQFSAEKIHLAAPGFTVFDSTGHRLTVIEVPLNCLDSKRYTRFCLHITLGSITDASKLIEPHKLSYYRLHPYRLETSPKEIVYSRPSKELPELGSSTLAGISEMQTFYLEI